MKLVTYHSEGTDRVGMLDAERELVLEVAIPGPTGKGGLLECIESWGAPGAPTQAPADGVPLASVELRAPFRPRRNVFCVGKNYRDHSAEFARSGFDASGSPRGTEDPPELPIFFTKPASSVIGPGAPIDPHPGLTRALDYEAELAVIIGRGGRGIRTEQVWDHIWGYTIVNDVTARDLQRDHKQWFLGKSLDTFCPMGPWAVTADEVDARDLTVRCRVNGELRQEASTRDLIFDIPTLISVLSAGITLQPGDIIATGTPAGVGIGFAPPRFLQSADVVEAEITGLGRLVNPVGTGGQATA
ncbi:MAG: fumarylacetoacetate hydrolase family protein [Streptomycetales bacterium]